MSERLVYRVDEVAELLGVGKSTVYDSIAKGDEIPGVLRVGRRILISRAALHAALGLNGDAELLGGDDVAERKENGSTRP